MKGIKIIKKNATSERNQSVNSTAESSEPEKRWTEIETVESWVKIWRERKTKEISRAFDQLNAASINRGGNIFSR